MYFYAVKHLINLIRGTFKKKLIFFFFFFFFALYKKYSYTSKSYFFHLFLLKVVKDFIHPQTKEWEMQDCQKKKRKKEKLFF